MTDRAFRKAKQEEVYEQFEKTNISTPYITFMNNIISLKLIMKYPYEHRSCKPRIIMDIPCDH